MAATATLARRQQNQAAINRARAERDAERAKAARAREQARAEKAEKKALAKRARAERKELVKEYGKLALILGFAVAIGTTVGGQLTRVDRPWMSKLQWSLLAIGLLMLVFARGRQWMIVGGITFLGMGGIKLGDMSRSRDWIPGDNAWETIIPPAGSSGHKVVVVPNNG